MFHAEINHQLDPTNKISLVSSAPAPWQSAARNASRMSAVGGEAGPHSVERCQRGGGRWTSVADTASQHWHRPPDQHDRLTRCRRGEWWGEREEKEVGERLLLEAFRVRSQWNLHISASPASILSKDQ